VPDIGTLSEAAEERIHFAGNTIAEDHRVLAIIPFEERVEPLLQVNEPLLKITDLKLVAGFKGHCCLLE
jgi:hypothetical protein